MATITKREIAERIAKRTGQTQVVTKQIVQYFLDEIVEELAKANKLEFRDFGIFEVVTRRSRNGRNPRTGQKVFVPAKCVVSFKMGRRMKRVVAGPGQVQPEGIAAESAPGQDAVPAPDPAAAPAPPSSAPVSPFRTPLGTDETDSDGSSGSQDSSPSS